MPRRLSSTSNRQKAPIPSPCLAGLLPSRIFPAAGESASMKITEVRTSLVAVPRSRAVADATATNMGTGGHCFVHVATDEGVEGLGMSTASRAVREVIEHDLKPLLIGADPLHIEGLWQAMFWRVRGFGRKGVAIQALSAVDIALWDLKAKYLGLPLFKLLGPCREAIADLRQRWMDLIHRRGACRGADRLRRTRDAAREDEGRNGLRFQDPGRPEPPPRGA